MAQPRVPRVLLDATNVLDTSGHRGIGRFVDDLLHGLAARAPEDVRLEVLVDLSPLGRPRVLADLVTAARDVRERRGELIDRIAPRRALHLGPVSLRADLVYLPEPRGVPPLSRPLVITTHDLIPLRFPADYLGRSPLAVERRTLAERARLSRARRIVAISRRTAADVRELLAPSAPIDVVSNGIDLDRCTAVAAPDDVARRDRLRVPSVPYVLYVGYCDPRKNVEGMLRAIAAEPRVHLVWAGELEEGDHARLEQRARALGIADRVHRLGFVSDADLSALYRGALAHLFLSRLEGFGLSTVEALACGCPVIVAQDSGADEIAGDAAARVSPDDPRQASDAIGRLIDQPATERESLVAAGLARAKTFDRRTMADGYLAVFQRALGR